MTMIDFRSAKILSHRRNLQRYGRLLATELTELEREYLHRRIAEEHAELERLQLHENQSAQRQPEEAGTVIAAQALGERTGGQSHV